MTTPAYSNDAVATALERLADRLADREVNPYRVQAYRTAAQTLRFADRPVTALLAEGGLDALKALPGIGDRLADRIAVFVATGRFDLPDPLTHALPPEALFTRIPGIGRELARRIYDELQVNTLEDLEVAAHDGRLERVDGFGRRRIRALRDLLHTMLSRRPARRLRATGSLFDESPPVGMLLSVDREYRAGSRRDELPRIAPRRFNSSGTAWLPILRTYRPPWAFTALFSNTARAHQLDKTADWVVLHGKREGQSVQYTVVTETRGDLKGRRVVRGREAECRAYYAEHAARPAAP